MKVLVDENIPHMTVDRLLELGHDVKDVRGTPHEGITDSELWAIAMSACDSPTGGRFTSR
jgi:predicted nuclease of predicted toxin-antitoxin system